MSSTPEEYVELSYSWSNFFPSYEYITPSSRLSAAPCGLEFSVAVVIPQIKAFLPPYYSPSCSPSMESFISLLVSLNLKVECAFSAELKYMIMPLLGKYGKGEIK